MMSCDHDTDTFFKMLIAELYDLHSVTLVPLGLSRGDQRVLYRVDHASGESWVLRASPQALTVPWWFGGESVGSWLRNQATILRYLAQQDYPAPRLVPMRTDSSPDSYEGWCSLMTSFTEGKRMENGPQNLYALASVLGRLHTLPERSGTLPPAVNAWWYPQQTLVHARSLLVSIAPEIPPRFHALATSVEQTLGAIQHSSHLPLTIIHGDCWPENALQTSQGTVMLLDWECAGLGVAVLDVGGLLIDCHPEPGPGEEIQADPEKIAAVVEGYCQERMLQEAEVEILREALRFSSAFQVAIRFSWAQQEGWSERIERSLTRLSARFRACEQIAPLVLEHLKRVI